MPAPLHAVRRRYAEHICALAETQRPELLRAFAAVPRAWVRLLNDGGRLMIPLTGPSSIPGIGLGAVLLVTRRGAVFDAEFVSGTMIYDDQAGRTAAAGERLAAAFPRSQGGRGWSLPPVASLRLETNPDTTCWLAGDGWWLSTEPA